MVHLVRGRNCHLEVQSDLPGRAGKSTQDWKTHIGDPFWTTARRSRSSAGEATPYTQSRRSPRDCAYHRRHRLSCQCCRRLGGASLVKLLLDTHIWLWSVLEPERRSHRVAREIQDPANQLWLSAISVWELIMLWQNGRMVAGKDIQTWIPD